MATIDEYLSPVDIRDAHVLTRIVERRVAESENWDIPFCPINTTSSRRVKLKVRHTDGAGLAAFKAENANTPIVAAGGDLTEVYLELLLLAEKSVIKASDMIQLQSPDPNVARTQAAEITDKATRLRQRNINRTKWMAWEAVKDSLTITYPDTTTIEVDFDLNGDAQNDWFGATHLATTSTAWSNIASDIEGDVYAGAHRIAEDLGVAEGDCVLYVSSTTWRNMRKNTAIKAELSTYQPRVLTATMDEVVQILGIRAIRIYNDFYLTSSSGTDTKNKFLGDGHVLITGPETINGDPIMEVLDGPIAYVENGQIRIMNNPGAQSEIYINEEQIAANVRVQTSRIPIINYPAAFYWLDIDP